MTVSVIIPNYNHAEFLKLRIESVLNQSYQDFKIIILDDCSTDNSLEIIEHYRRNPKVSHIVYNEVNSGSTFKQWNKGINLASGKYIWIAESDDFADPLLLDALIQKLEIYSNVGLAYCNSRIVDNKNNFLEAWDIWMKDLDPFKWKQDYVNSGKNEIKNFSIIRNTIPNASGVIFRRSLYLDVGGADESFKFVGDWHLWIRMLERMDVAYVANCFNYFRRHTGTTRARYQIPGSGYVNEVYVCMNYIFNLFKYRPPLLNKSLEDLFYIWHQNSLKVFLKNLTWQSFVLASRIDPLYYTRVCKFLSKYISMKVVKTKIIN